MNETPQKTQEVKVGSIFCMSWGYDQTNVNYFEVVELTPKGVKVREIGASTVPGSEGFMSCNVKPSKGRFLDRSQWCGGYSSNNPPTFRRLTGLGSNSVSFNFRGRYFARLVSEDSTTYNSWYA